VPTVADLQARRLEITRASLRERLIAGNLDQTRVVVEALASEFDIVDIAAAAVQLAHSAAGGDGDDREIPAHSPAPSKGHRQGAVPRPARGRTAGEKPGLPTGDYTRVFVGAGRTAGIRPGDLVGAITGELGIESRSIGAIEINDAFSLIELPESIAEDVIDALRATKLRGLKVKVRRER